MSAKFVLFAQGRTGSTLLGELLGSHPDVYFADEILAEPVASVDRALADLARGHSQDVVGFHVKIYQLTDTQGVGDVGAWLRGVVADGWRLITLRRDNLLRQVLSNLAADAAGRFHDRSGGATDVRLRVDPSVLVHWMEVREQVGAAEDAALGDLPRLSLAYERDLLDSAAWAATASHCFSYLGLSTAPVTTSLRRLNSGALADLVENVADVTSALTGTRFEQFLD
jgi:LPS sulfotransferase NodH